jgi:DNA/RNA-binding domain of Phe-tRNA-synthetase-like protein
MIGLADVTSTTAWSDAFPGASIGLLVMRDLSNPASHPALDARKVALAAELRARFDGYTRSDLRVLPVLHVYDRYYRRFGKTYHVQLQLESVALKGKPIGSVASLVEAMFMAELNNHLLTAVHDLDALVAPLRVDVAREPLPYTLANGKEGALQPGDMYMSDGSGVICSIIYGQDARTRVTPATRSALFVVYAPPGIDPGLVSAHLEDIAALVRLVSPAATSEIAILQS